MEKTQEVFEYSKELFSNWFSGGQGLRHVPLKNYTSGDHGEEGFESITNKVMHKALTVYGLNDRCDINGDYFKDPSDVFDNQRMDNHVWIDGKVVIVEEDRALMDKPFYTLKRGVVKQFMELPHVKKDLSKNVKFIFSTLAISVSNSTRSTCDKIFKYGDIISEVNFSGRSRNQTQNYFHKGYNQKELDKYVETICGVFSKYE